VPAFDVFQLKENEGKGYEDELRMLFAGERVVPDSHLVLR
jgi:hypothetical protein